MIMPRSQEEDGIRNVAHLSMSRDIEAGGQR